MKMVLTMMSDLWNYVDFNDLYVLVCNLGLVLENFVRCIKFYGSFGPSCTIVENTPLLCVVFINISDL